MNKFEIDKEKTLLYIYQQSEKYTMTYILGMIDMAFFTGLIGINKRIELKEFYGLSDNKIT